jgi:hypothetical protein
MYDYLLTARDDATARYAMVGYQLRNTLTEYGSVARGVCRIDADGFLAGVDERLKIMWRDGRIAYTEDDATWVDVPVDSTVSMNFWGFTPSFMDELASGFPDFLSAVQAGRLDSMKAEYLLPLKVDELIRSGKASVQIMNTDERWYGVTYKEDKAPVMAAFQSLKDRGAYPDKLWR